MHRTAPVQFSHGFTPAVATARSIVKSIYLPEISKTPRTKFGWSSLRIPRLQNVRLKWTCVFRGSLFY